MKRLLLIVFVVSAIGLSSWSASPALAQSKPATGKKAAKSSKVYVCKSCKVYFQPASAKKMGYKDAMGHKLVPADKAPAGYTDGSKMKMGGKM